MLGLGLACSTQEDKVSCWCARQTGNCKGYVWEVYDYCLSPESTKLDQLAGREPVQLGGPMIQAGVLGRGVLVFEGTVDVCVLCEDIENLKVLLW